MAKLNFVKKQNAHYFFFLGRVELRNTLFYLYKFTFFTKINYYKTLHLIANNSS